MNYLKKLLGEDFKKDMDLDDISKLLADKQVVKKDDMESIYKENLNKKTSELAKLKKQLKEKEDSNEDTETNERLIQLQESYDALKKESDIQKYKNSYLANGYSDELADKAANAIYEGNLDEVFECQSSFFAAKEQEIKESILKDTTPPPVGGEEINNIQAVQAKVDEFISNGEGLQALVEMEKLIK